ncbi:hypothetical protein PENTCL1PPCAC_1873, partial [Pristionchus entomophagus]
MNPTRKNHPPQGGDLPSNPSSQPVHTPLQVNIDPPGQGSHSLQWVSPQARSSAPTSPSSAYSTDREAIIQRTNPGSTTIAETHVLRSTGMQSQSFTEEHWTSEIKSFVACVPPKFLQVIKAYRVLSTDTLTLVVEVVSDPPAIFEWFVNDRPVLADRRRFSARHGLNITSLTVHSPEGGVYKCTARNPAGLSTSYGYVNISDPPRYEEWSESSRLARQEEHSSRTSLVVINQAPRFLNQVPNLTLQPGCEAVLDVEVDANPPARFQWFVNGFEHVDGSGRVEYFYPTNNRCVARFIIPVAGEYKVVATNVHGTAISSGFVEIYKPNPSKSMRPPVAPGERISRASAMTTSGIALAPPREDHRERTAEGDSIITTREVTEVEMNYYQRSSSLPRHSRHIERHVEIPTLTPTSGRSRQTSEPREVMGGGETESAPRPLHKSKSETARYLPQPPVFVTQLPAEVLLAADDRLVLSVDAAALPTAAFTWTANGFELRSSKNLTLLHEQNRSTLVAQPPVKAGRYSVTARNDVGSATATTKVRHLPGAEPEAQPAPEFLESTVTVTSPEPPADEVGSTTSSVETVVRPTEDRPIVVPVPIPEESTPVRSTTGTPARDIGSGTTPRRSMSSTTSLPRQPAFTTQPEPSIHVKAGEQLRLETRIDAVPDASFRWYLNNFEIKANANVVIDRPSPNHSVATFTRPSPGNYKCTASNDLGSVTTTTRVTTEETYFEERREEKKEDRQTGVMFKLVRKTTSEGRKDFPKKPRIVDPLPTVIRLKSSEALELNVAAEAIPEAAFTWRLNNFELKPNANVSIEKTGENASRARFVVPSSGRYEAIAVNELGQDATSTKVIVEIPTSEGTRTYVAPVFTEVLPPSHLLDSSRETRLVVSAAGQPPLAFKWYLNGTEARTGELCSVQSEGNRSSLLLKLLPVEDVRLDVDVFNQHGVARCSTILVAPKAPPSAQALPSAPKVPEHQVAAPPVVSTAQFRAPRFAKALAPMEVNEGESLVAGVGVEKESTACEFVWSLRGEDVESRRDVFVDSTTHESLLTIPKVGAEMAGMIEVVAINEAGRASSAAELGVREKSDSFEIVPPTLPNERPPKIIEPLHSQMITEGTRIELHCKIDALPSAMISWSKDEREIEGEGVEANVLPGGVCALTRVSATPVDSGLYKCAAANAHGTAETSAFIAVEALVKEQPEEKEDVEQLADMEIIQLPPEFIEQLFIEPEEQENCVHLVCRVSSAAPTAITWYRGPQPINASEKYEMHSLSDGTQSLSIHGVTREDEGVYTCKAESEFGVGETSGELLHPEQPEQQAQQLQPDVSVASEISADVTFAAPSENMDESAEIRKKEEEFKLLVKVADCVADELVAVVFLDAVTEAARFIADEQDEDSSSETYQTCAESLQSTGPPRFDSKIEEYTARVGETLRIETKIRGVPTPFIEWYCGERKLGVGMDTSMSYKKCTTSLTLMNIREDQTGMYYCHATNCHGVALLSCKVEVTPTGSTRRVSVTPNDDPIVIIDAPLPSVSTGTLVAPEQSEGRAIVVAAPETHEVVATFAAQSTATAAAPVARTFSPTKHDETVKSLSEKLKTPSKDATVIQQVNELMSAALAVKEELKSDEESNVEIRRPTAIYEKIVTVVEPEQVELHLHTSAPGGEIHHRFINLETILQKPGTSNASFDTAICRPGKRNANAEHRIVVLEGTSQNFSDAMTWSLKKVKRAMEDGRTTPTTNASVEIRRPGDTAEQITTIAEPEEYIPELLQIASSASKLKMSNVTVSLVRAGDVAHQELVIEYESNVEDDADLAVKQLVFPGFSSRDEARWNKPRRDLFSASESLNTAAASAALPPASPHFRLQQQVQLPSPERQSDPNVVAVFVEVEAACPDQSVEIVAVVATPLTGQETSAGPAGSYDRGLQPRGSVAESASSMNDEHSNMISISESSSGTGFEAPKFIRILTDSSARAGEPAVFKCLVRGVPMPEVRWSVDGDEITSDGDYTIIYEDGVCLLKINQVLPEDEGEYACESFNDAGHAVTRAFLTVEQPPRPATPTNDPPTPIPPPRRFVQHAPLKTDVYDEEIEGGAETDHVEEDEDASCTDLPAFCGSKKSLDRVSIASSSKGRLVTSNSEFDLSRLVDYNQDLRESSMFVRYFDTAETMVVVRVLYEEERVALTCHEISGSLAPPTPKKRSIFHMPDIFKKKKAAPPVPPKTQKSIEEYQKELMRRSSTESAPTTPLTPKTETAIEILEKAMANLDREATPKVEEEEIMLKKVSGSVETTPAARQPVVAAAAAAAASAACSPMTNVDEVLSFIDGLKEELSFATAPSETQTEDDLRNELMSLTAGMREAPSPVM